MKFKLFLIILVLAVFALYGADRTIPLTDLGRPVALDVDEHNLYIIENSRIHIHALADFKRIATFGAKGQGPGEFLTLGHVPITLDASSDELIVGSIRKVSYFDKSGRFLREARGHSLALRLALLDRSPAGDRFLGWSQTTHQNETYNTIVIFDHEVNAVRELYREKDPFQGQGKGYDMLPKVFSFCTHQDKILLPGPDDASIDIFDKAMVPLARIRVDQKPDEVSDTFKQQMIKFLKTSPETKNTFPLLVPLRFPSVFPVISDFFADQGLVYVMTWRRTDGKNEFYIYDLTGKFMQRKMIPIRYETDLQAYPTLIRNGKIYQLVENESAQEWELTVADLEG